MEQLTLRVLDGHPVPKIGEKFYKRDHNDGKMRDYQLAELVNQIPCEGIDMQYGRVKWTDFTYNLEEVAPTD
jgi:hypothetical protein